MALLLLVLKQQVMPNPLFSMPKFPPKTFVPNHSEMFFIGSKWSNFLEL